MKVLFYFRTCLDAPKPKTAKIIKSKIVNNKIVNQTSMIAVIAVVFGIIAIFLLILLAGLTCMGWFGLTNKVKELVNKLLVRSHDQEFRNIERVAINT